MPTPLPAFLLALVAGSVPLAPAVGQGAPQGGAGGTLLGGVGGTFQGGAGGTFQSGAGGTLEDWLARLRASEHAALEALRPEVELRLARLATAVESQRVDEIRRARESLVELGPVAASLLVPALEPRAALEAAPARPLEQAQEIARQVSRALVELPTPATTDALLALLLEGSAEARANAARALASSPEPARASAGLAEVWRASAAEPELASLRAIALRSLARLGGEDALAIVSEALAEPEPELVRVALDALSESAREDAVPRVLLLTRDRARAAALVPALLRFWQRQPQKARAEALEPLLALCLSSAVPAAERVRLLEALPGLAGGLPAELRRQLAPLAEGPAGELREAALVALSLAGERGARKDLLASYDAQVEKNPRWAKPYEARAAVLVRIGEYRDAIRDYREALRLAEDDPRMQVGDAWVGLARCYARTGKLKDAAQTLRRSTLSLKELAALAQDPDFAELAQSRYAEEAFPR